MSAEQIVFVGSSSEGQAAARQLHDLLRGEGLDSRFWSNQFPAGQSYIDSLQQQVDEVDAAVFFLSPDDITESRGDRVVSPRDNLIFELGMFSARRGIGAALMVVPHGILLKLPSDLDGIAQVSVLVPAAVAPTEAQWRDALVGKVGEIARIVRGLPSRNLPVDSLSTRDLDRLRQTIDLMTSIDHASFSESVVLTHVIAPPGSSEDWVSRSSEVVVPPHETLMWRRLSLRSTAGTGSGARSLSARVDGEICLTIFVKGWNSDGSTGEEWVIVFPNPIRGGSEGSSARLEMTYTWSDLYRPLRESGVDTASFRVRQTQELRLELSFQQWSVRPSVEILETVNDELDIRWARHATLGSVATWTVSNPVPGARYVAQISSQ